MGSQTGTERSDSSASEVSQRGSGKRLLGFLVLLGVLLVAALTLPVVDWLQALIQWSAANRGISWVVFIFTYVVATVLLLPGSLLTLAAGYLFGLPLGFAVVSFGSVAGACCAFLLGRHGARDWVAQRISGNAKFAALDTAVRDKGLVIVLLTRLSPVFPFNLLNYALGITSVRFLHYLLGSWLGMIPGTLLYVYLGSAAQNLTELFAGGPSEAGGSGWLLYVGLGATLLLTILITRFATQALNSQLAQGSLVTTKASNQ